MLLQLTSRYQEGMLSESPFHFFVAADCNPLKGLRNVNVG